VKRTLESMLDAVLDGVVLLDTNGEVEYLNPEACRILDTSSKVAAGKSIESVVGVDHSIAKLARTVLGGGRAIIEREHRLEGRAAGDSVGRIADDSAGRDASDNVGREAGDRVLDVSVSPLLDGDQIDGAALMLRDCAIQSGLHEFVAQHEALSSFGRIAAGIAHEVKNPLGGIRGAAEILASRAPDTKSRSTAELIVREVDRISLLVEDFMVFARGENLRLAPLNIHRVVDDVLALTVLEPIAFEVEVKREFDPSIPELLGDADRLSQVFLNVIRNALQAMEGGAGVLEITTRMTLEHQISSPDGRRSPTVLIEFTDTGPGIEAAVLAKLATPFFTTRPDGTGLGLAQARHWVVRHEGSLRIENAPGSGATVRITLPLQRPT
jgi:two-component system nitrogen regulation sensor histidine kinase GlnL